MFTAIKTTTVAHIHDCDCCTHHGALCANEALTFMDVYTCGDALVIRFAADGPDYYSLPLAIAREIAEDKAGLYGTAMQLVK